MTLALDKFTAGSESPPIASFFHIIAPVPSFACLEDPFFGFHSSIRPTRDPVSEFWLAATGFPDFPL
jgi:hypothetical protein